MALFGVRHSGKVGLGNREKWCSPFGKNSDACNIIGMVVAVIVVCVVPVVCVVVK